MAEPAALTLLERLAQAQVGAVKSQRIDADALRRSILGNLSDILNTELGSAQAQPDLGVPPPHELLATYPASVERMVQAIVHCIERYEPRLAGVQVFHLPRSEEDALELRFRIAAEIPALAGTGNARLGLETCIQHNGRVVCRGGRGP
jgi:type VI secretion system protein